MYAFVNDLLLFRTYQQLFQGDEMMKRSFRWYCLVALTGVLGPAGVAQDGIAPKRVGDNPPAETEGVLKHLSTLEELRSWNTSEELDTSNPGANLMGMSGMEGGADGAMGATGRQILLQQINALRSLLYAPDQDRKELEPMLRELLAEYFVADMEERLQEFDRVKAKVAQLESKLQTRLDRRYEVVELQLKQIFHKADGLDFSVPESANMGMGMGMGMDTGMGMGSVTSGSGSIGIGGEGGMPGMSEGSSAMTYPLGYDVGFGMTRYLRLPGKPLKLQDALGSYLELDANSYPTNNAAEINAGASDKEKLEALFLAMHGFYDIFDHFPAPMSRRDRSEKPHSWRVALLPLLGHAELYRQYRFDEPWDSESNLKLIEKMPAIFGSNDDSEAKSGKTPFQMLVGNGAAFNLNRPTGMNEITDGTSNTIGLVVAKTSVPWTKPEDVPFVPNATLSKLAPSKLIVMCDGKVRTLPAGGEQVLNGYATRAGGEVSLP